MTLEYSGEKKGRKSATSGKRSAKPKMATAWGDEEWIKGLHQRFKKYGWAEDEMSVKKRGKGRFSFSYSMTPRSEKAQALVRGDYGTFERLKVKPEPSPEPKKRAAKKPSKPRPKKKEKGIVEVVIVALKLDTKKPRKRAKGKPDRSKRAEDFGDDPKIRQKHGEASKTAESQWWETDYKKRKKKKG